LDEAEGEAVITVRRTSGSRGKIYVNYSVLSLEGENRAVLGEDYTHVSGTLTWEDGDIEDREIRVPLIDDDIVEPDESFDIILEDPIGVIFGSTVGTTVTIIDDDAYGVLEFSRPEYFVNENGGQFRITVLRRDGKSGAQTVSYNTTDRTATIEGDNADYRPAAGTFEFEPDDYSKEFVVEILDDGSLENNEVFGLTLSNLEGGATLGVNQTATVMIVDNEASNAPSGVLDVGYSLGAGFNGSIRDLELMPDGRLILAGLFSRFNNMEANSIARLSSKGQLDQIFNVGGGPNGAINVVKLFQGQYLLIGGEFTEFNGNNYNHLARLNLDGVIDDTFNIGSAANGKILSLKQFHHVNGTIWSASYIEYLVQLAL
jgi:hypothetical protein